MPSVRARRPPGGTAQGSADRFAEGQSERRGPVMEMPAPPRSQSPSARGGGRGSQRARCRGGASGRESAGAFRSRCPHQRTPGREEDLAPRVQDEHGEHVVVERVVHDDLGDVDVEPGEERQVPPDVHPRVRHHQVVHRLRQGVVAAHHVGGVCGARADGAPSEATRRRSALRSRRRARGSATHSRLCRRQPPRTAGLRGSDAAARAC